MGDIPDVDFSGFEQDLFGDNEGDLHYEGDNEDQVRLGDESPGMRAGDDESPGMRALAVLPEVPKEVCEDTDEYQDLFEGKNVIGKWGASPHQKMTPAMRMLVYGIMADAIDEYSRLGESTINESFQHFIRAIPQIYGATYLRLPMKDDLTRLLRKASQREFPEDERPDDPIDESDDESDPEDRLWRAVSHYDGVEETPSSQSVLTLEERFACHHLIRSSTIHARLKHD
ncbi:hypothetical protein LWI29_006178 [Acer saccharum]|uniref:Uncharacterized protein n=1 Tax=Acer saccharum TaxID=4024 RepID=A0AA39STJ7_ACESA|nr:hypothetical protein LWI29_006178 [Acer saccharum]